MEHIKNFTDHLVGQSWQIAVLFLIIAVGSFLLRNKSSHWRYLLWCVVLAKCLLPPVMTFNAAVLPFDVKETPSIKLGANLQRESGIENRELNNQKPNNNIQTVSNNQNPKLDEKEIASSSRSGTPRNDSGYGINWPVRLYAFFVWGVGAIVFLIVAGVRAFLLNRWILRHRQLPGEDVSGEIEKLKNTVSSKFLGRIWVVDKITQPFVWGLWHGCVYLPAGSKNSADVIMHELAHIIRLDAFVNFLQIFAQAIFWFHPFVWIANNKIRAEREKSCDEIAIARLKVSPKSYSSAVVDVLVREYQARMALPSLAVAGPVKNIEERIRTIMAQGKKFYSRPTAGAVITVLVLAAICVPTTIAITKVGEPDFVIKGKVVDSTTGKPIAGAIVGDTERYNEGKFQTTTDANGDYSYKTWYEEHGVKSEADGYKRQNNGFGTKLFGSEKEKIIDFALEPEKDTAAHSTGSGQAENTEVTKRNADLYIEDFNISPYEAGGLYTVTAKIGNHGTVDAPQFRLNFYKGDPADNLNLHGKAQTGYHGAGPIKAGDFWNECSSPFALDDGNNVLFVILDTNKDVAETDENNNQALLRITLKGGKIIKKTFINSVIITRLPDGNIRLEGGMSEQSSCEGKVSLTHIITTGNSLSPDGRPADAREETASNKTPLHLAAMNGHREMVEMLLSKGADINGRDSDSNTPLHLAAAGGHLDLCGFLIEKGADVNAKNIKGQTPLDMAATHGHRQTAELLIVKGAMLKSGKQEKEDIKNASDFLFDGKIWAIGRMFALNEKDLTKGLKFFAEISDGKYPSSLDAETVIRELKNYLAAKEQKGEINYTNASKQEKQKMKSKILDVFFASAYWLSLKEKDPYYNNDITAADNDKILVRWKTSETKYRVVYGDLRIETIDSQLSVSKGTAFDQLLSKNVTVDIDKSPGGGDLLTVQYAVIAVCDAVGVPYKWEKSAKLAEPQRRSFIEPLHIKDKVAREAIADILKPFGLNYAIDSDGLFIYKKQGQVGNKEIAEVNLPIELKAFDEWSMDTFKQYLDVSENSDSEDMCLRELKAGKGDDVYWGIAISRLGYLKSKKAIPDLAVIAFRRQGKGNRDRWMAVRSLGLIGDKAVMGDLIHLLYYYNQNVRLYARVSLVRLAGKDLGPDWQKWAAWYKNRVDDNFSTKKIEWTADKKMANEKLQVQEDQILLKHLVEEWKIKNKYSHN